MRLASASTGGRGGRSWGAAASSVAPKIANRENARGLKWPNRTTEEPARLYRSRVVLLACAAVLLSRERLRLRNALTLNIASSPRANVDDAKGDGSKCSGGLRFGPEKKGGVRRPR